MTGMIISVLLGVLGLVVLIVGLKKGFAKHITKPLCSFVALVLAVVLAFVLIPIIKQQGFYSGILDWPTSWFGDAVCTTEVHSAEELFAVMSTNYLKILNAKANDIYSTMSANQFTTLGRYFADLTTSVILALLLGIAVFLACKYLFFGIRYLLQKISKVAVLSTIDRLLGGIWAIAWCYLIVIVLLTGLELISVLYLPIMQPFVQSLVSEGTENFSIVLQLLHQTNIIGSTFVESMFPGQIDLLNLILIG